ncbi:MAG TPA: RDD family protein [Hydrogenophaga sp.]|uniref:RDD family protein n=2 Tax=Hydrogenophaga sp. TaxID=1904254 RepID=UPI002BA88861|nr:RDD family protein [Hydrogenophaga sp.]HMN92353.1 RDD family protein [Hydrogenophaga sp.]
MTPPSNPAPPDAVERAGAATTSSLIAPPLPRRMACWLYEGMLLFGVVFIAGSLFSTLTQTRHALDNRHLQQAFLFTVFGIYFVWLWSKGQTLAMKTWHIRVVDRDGRPLTQARALLRYVLSWIWVLPPLAAGGLFTLSGAEVSVLFVGWVLIWAILARFHPERQFLHDAMAGTRLVHYKPPPPPGKRRWWM